MSKEHNIKAIIVAGGRGERLRPLTDSVPKPMIEVNGKPILEHTLDLLKNQGITDYIFALCYLPEVITGYFGNGSKWGVNIAYTFEDPATPLGTAGAIVPAREYIDGTFIVTYADILRDLEVRRMINQHLEKRSLATLNVYQHKGVNFKSSIEFGDDSKLLKFTELPQSIVLEKGSVWSNGSFYIFEPGIFDFIPENEKVDFSRDVFPQLISSGKPIHVYPSAGYFIDIGTPENLQIAQNHLGSLLE